MTVAELFEYVDEILENPFSDNIKRRWMNQIEAEIQVDVLLMAPEGIVKYGTDDNGAELIVPAPYDELYSEYLFWRICLAQHENELADNYAATFNRLYNEYVRFVCETINPGCGVAERLRYYLSAYQIAVKHGFPGTEKDWLDSLKGAEGKPGAGLHIKGYVRSENELPENPEQGTGYLVGEKNLLYIWDGTAWFYKQPLRGDPGYTPQKGVDYWTPEEEAEITEAKNAATTAANNANTAANNAAAAASRANTATESAGLAANDARTAAEDIRQAKERGDFDGEPFTYEDFTPEQLEALRGPAGSDADVTAENIVKALGYTPEKEGEGGDIPVVDQLPDPSGENAPGVVYLKNDETDDDNVEIELDDTLTEKGMAADAAAVGTAINQLSSKNEEFQTELLEQIGSTVITLPQDWDEEQKEIARKNIKAAAEPTTAIVVPSEGAGKYVAVRLDENGEPSDHMFTGEQLGNMLVAPLGEVRLFMTAEDGICDLRVCGSNEENIHFIGIDPNGNTLLFSLPMAGTEGTLEKIPLGSGGGKNARFVVFALGADSKTVTASAMNDDGNFGEPLTGDALVDMVQDLSIETRFAMVSGGIVMVEFCRVHETTYSAQFAARLPKNDYDLLIEMPLTGTDGTIEILPGVDGKVDKHQEAVNSYLVMGTNGVGDVVPMNGVVGLPDEGAAIGKTVRVTKMAPGMQNRPMEWEYVDFPNAVPAPATAEVGQVMRVAAVDANGKPTEWEPYSAGEYELPVASPETLGGVKPEVRSDEMTQPVGVDDLGALWTMPGASGGGRVIETLISDVITEEGVTTYQRNLTSDEVKKINNATFVRLTLNTNQSAVAVSGVNFYLWSNYAHPLGSIGTINFGTGSNTRQIAMLAAELAEDRKSGLTCAVAELPGVNSYLNIVRFTSSVNDGAFRVHNNSNIYAKTTTETGFPVGTTFTLEVG